MSVVALPSWCQSFPISPASVARKQPLWHYILVRVCQPSCQCFPCQCFSLQYNRNRHALLTGVVRAQLILAIDYCHKKNIVNRDIKLENTLLETNPRPNAKPLLKLCGTRTF